MKTPENLFATDLHLSSLDDAQRLIARVPPLAKPIKRKELIRQMPDILETALGLILDEIDATPGQTSPGAIGCRIIASCIARLRD